MFLIYFLLFIFSASIFDKIFTSMFLQMMCHAGKPTENQKKWQKTGKKCHFNI